MAMPASRAKLDSALAHWDYAQMKSRQAKRDAWLQSEVAYIKGWIHRATGTADLCAGRILQIGAGPCDVIDHWREGERHAIDPLADEYKKSFGEFRDGSVIYAAGVGEQMPYDDGYFDVVIIRNAIDHFDNPRQALQETHRVLKPGGALYLWTYLYPPLGSLVYRLINSLTGRFATEPWAFTRARLRRILSKTGFEPRFPVIEERAPAAPPSGETGPLPQRVKRWLRRLLLRRVMGVGTRAFIAVAVPAKDGIRA